MIDAMDKPLLDDVFKPSRSPVNSSSSDLRISISLYEFMIFFNISSDMIGQLFLGRMKRIEENGHFIVSSNAMLFSDCEDGVSLSPSGFSRQFSKLSFPRMKIGAIQRSTSLSGLDLSFTRILIVEQQFHSTSDAGTNILYYGCDWYRGWTKLEFT